MNSMVSPGWKMARTGSSMITLPDSTVHPVSKVWSPSLTWMEYLPKGASRGMIMLSGMLHAPVWSAVTTLTAMMSPPGPYRSQTMEFSGVAVPDTLMRSPRWYVESSPSMVRSAPLEWASSVVSPSLRLICRSAPMWSVSTKSTLPSSVPGTVLVVTKPPAASVFSGSILLPPMVRSSS